jgi:putative tryptophan/tyrosine transport system substrate-binding protein
VPAVSELREFAVAGGLISYGTSYNDAYRQASVQQSAKVELIVNLRTAKTLGLTIPLTLLARADEIIE